jgi:hypothetical protein
VSQQDWINLIAIGLLASVIGAVLAFILVKPRRQLAAPLVISTAIAIVIYLLPPGELDADAFHIRLGFAIVAVLGVALVALAIRARRTEPSGRVVFGVIAVSLFGVSLPVIALFALFAVACAGGGCD